MSFQALEWARKLPIPPTPKFLMMVIASYTDTDDACFPALTTLADDTRQSIDSVRRQVTKLHGAGLLKRYPRWQTGKDSFSVGQPGEECPRGCRRTSDKIQLLLKADLGAAETYFDPDKAANIDTPPVADCEGDGSKDPPSFATAPVAAMVLPQEDSLEGRDRESRAREPLISEAAKQLSDDCLNAIGIDPSDPPLDWCGFPYQAQILLNRNYDRLTVVAACARLAGMQPRPPPKYFLKTIETDCSKPPLRAAPQNQERHHAKPSDRSFKGALAKLDDRIRELKGGLSGGSEDPVRLLSDGRRERS